MDLRTRKSIRLENRNYSKNGAYFITICVQDRHELLGEIVVGGDDLGAPYVKLSEHGNIVQRNIELIELHYRHVSVDKYVIMPNHIHIIIVLSNPTGGVPGSSRPTALIPSIVAALKKFSTKQIGYSIWQRSYHDHIIRNEDDYLRICQYIDENPAKWKEDYYFV